MMLWFDCIEQKAAQKKKNKHEYTVDIPSFDEIDAIDLQPHAPSAHHHANGWFDFMSWQMRRYVIFIET